MLRKRDIWRCSIGLLTAAAMLGAPGTASAISREAAESGLASMVTTRVDKEVSRFNGFDSYRGSCKRRSSRRFTCHFRASVVDTAWQGHGTLKYVGHALFRYSFRGRKEGCGYNGCKKLRGLRWRGRTPYG